MKRTFILTILCLTTSILQAQTPRIISKNKVDWKQFPKLYTDINKEQFIKPFSALSEVDVEEITYWSDSLKIEAFAAIPKKEGKYPVIIYNRGGNRDFGALQLLKGKFKYPVAYFFTQLAKEGYIVIGCNYRGCGKSEGKDEFGGNDVNDILNLIEVLKEIPQADVSRIGMYGWSRGGMMTYLALTKTNQIKAAVVGGAPTDNMAIERPMMETGVYAELIPNYWKNKDVELKKRSACHFAEQFSKEVPILILHGNADWRVKSTHALKLALELDKYRVPYRLKIFEGGDHGLGAFRPEVNKEVLSWFERFLKNNEPVPNMVSPNKE